MYKIPIKTPEEIDIMRTGGKVVAQIFIELKNVACAGQATLELEDLFIEKCAAHGLIPECKGYAPLSMPKFPTGLIVSLNDESVHNYPKKGKVIRDGDLVTFDTAVSYNGLFLDHAISFGVGEISEAKKKLLDTANLALEKSVEKIREGVRVGLISHTMQKIVEHAGYSVLVDYAGHGIGRKMHEPPEIPCYGRKHEGPKLKAGMTLAIEPLVCEFGNKLTYNEDDVWEARTVDGGNFVQVEDTVLVTKEGFEILTNANE